MGLAWSQASEAQGLAASPTLLSCDLLKGCRPAPFVSALSLAVGNTRRKNKTLEQHFLNYSDVLIRVKFIIEEKKSKEYESV